ncbi:stage VI sporulation protein D [Bacillus suaedaesalsae]|uniref:Stage VI sporulation protein D n=1 Tax=Bacillus suaedaesalsae TaxID=2810349 RepID=A0ABS2DMT2_9BACI|nr:stage VI sporulation protein D [Bacillus suaedaesalsae]MBM6619769.1 stage VI sporulation protein D [Bacillus suaedaesalsae]
MTVDNQSSIRFTVEESIWFEKGQEVSELLSMSLDPEISIQEHEQYISVRGGLVLTGEYHARNTEDENNREFPTGARVVQEVTCREDGVSCLTHKFPVDITIPKNRIQSLNDVYVSIESFDYELPQRGNLLLEAELAITGIYGDQEEATSPVESEPVSAVAVEEEVVEETNELPREEELVQPLMRGFDEEPDSEEAEEDSSPFTPFVVEAKRDPSLSEEAVEVFSEVEELEEEQEVEQEVVEEEFLNANEEEEVAEEVADEEAYVFTRQAPQFEFKSRIETEKAEVENDDSAEHGKRDENTLYLTKIFAKEDESETTRLKMCIVQKDESLQAIAERYEVQPQTLIRVNNLEREDLAVGQILYIPVPAVSGK